MVKCLMCQQKYISCSSSPVPIAILNECNFDNEIQNTEFTFTRLLYVIVPFLKGFPAVDKGETSFFP